MQDKFVLLPDKAQVVEIGPTRTRFLVRSAQTKGRYSLVEHTFPPQFPGPQLHVHQDHEHAWLVLEGELTITLGDQVVAAREGTFVRVPPGIAHTFANP